MLPLPIPDCPLSITSGSALDPLFGLLRGQLLHRRQVIFPGEGVAGLAVRVVLEDLERRRDLDRDAQTFE